MSSFSVSLSGPLEFALVAGSVEDGVTGVTGGAVGSTGVTADVLGVELDDGFGATGEELGVPGLCVVGAPEGATVVAVFVVAVVAPGGVVPWLAVPQLSRSALSATCRARAGLTQPARVAVTADCAEKYMCNSPDTVACFSLLVIR